MEQPKQRRSLISPISAPNNDDDTLVWPGRGKTKKIVAVAGYQYGARFGRKIENGLVRRIARKHSAQQRDIVTEFPEQVAQVVGNVVIEQKLHSEAHGPRCAASGS